MLSRIRGAFLPNYHTDGERRQPGCYHQAAPDIATEIRCWSEVVECASGWFVIVQDDLGSGRCIWDMGRCFKVVVPGVTNIPLGPYCFLHYDIPANRIHGLLQVKFNVCWDDLGTVVCHDDYEGVCRQDYQA